MRQDGFVPQPDEPVSTSGDVINWTGHEGGEADERVRAARVALHDLVQVNVNPGKPVDNT